MNTVDNQSPLRYFERYRWYLQALNSKNAEFAKIKADISSGLISRDTYDENWQRKLRREIRILKRAINSIEFTINSIPETLDMLPCKLFLHLHYVVGLNMTETAEKLNVSESTVRRLRSRAEDYFKDIPLDTQKNKGEA